MDAPHTHRRKSAHTAGAQSVTGIANPLVCSKDGVRINVAYRFLDSFRISGADVLCCPF